MPSMQRLGTAEDLRWAEEYVAKSVGSNRVIYACIRPTEEEIKGALCSGSSILMFPCFWPHFLILSPCLIQGYIYSRKRLQHLTYILTNREIVSVVKDFKAPGVCCSSGTDNQIIPFSQIKAISTNQRGQGCASCQYPHVKIQYHQGTYTRHGHASDGTLDIIFSDPDSVVRLINDVRETAEISPPNYSASSSVSNSAPLAPVIGTELRCFVALNGDLSSKKVVKVYPQMSTQQLFDEISLKFNQGSTKYRLELLANGNDRVPIDGPADLSANDVVIAHTY